MPVLLRTAGQRISGQDPSKLWNIGGFGPLFEVARRKRRVA
jgi:hypothetical protein